jgi:hypothetical protein
MHLKYGSTSSQDHPALPSLAPDVVIALVAADVAHGVDGRAAAEHAAARHRSDAIVGERFRLALKAPVDARIAEQKRQPDRHVNPVIVVLAAGFQEQHFDGRIGAQPVGEHAAGRTRADDHVIEAADRIRRHATHRPRPLPGTLDDAE